jgi:hypothetical protein
MDLIGGAEEGRTPGLRIANAALCQLSYCPTARKNTASSFRFQVWGEIVDQSADYADYADKGDQADTADLADKVDRVDKADADYAD